MELQKHTCIDFLYSIFCLFPSLWEFLLRPNPKSINYLQYVTYSITNKFIITFSIFDYISENGTMGPSIAL